MKKKSNKRNIGKEILKGIKEIKAWQHGELKLRATKLNKSETKLRKVKA